MRCYRARMAAVVIAITGCSERPPPRVVPETAAEREALLLADQFVASQKMVDCSTPVEIAPGREPETYVVTYVTPEDEIELLGPRQLIVDLSSKEDAGRGTGPWSDGPGSKGAPEE